MLLIDMFSDVINVFGVWHLLFIGLTVYSWLVKSGYQNSGFFDGPIYPRASGERIFSFESIQLTFIDFVLSLCLPIWCVFSCRIESAFRAKKSNNAIQEALTNHISHSIEQSSHQHRYNSNLGDDEDDDYDVDVDDDVKHFGRFQRELHFSEDFNSLEQRFYDISLNVKNLKDSLELLSNSYEKFENRLSLTEQKIKSFSSQIVHQRRSVIGKENQR